MFIVFEIGLEVWFDNWFIFVDILIFLYLFCFKISLIFFSDGFKIFLLILYLVVVRVLNICMFFLILNILLFGYIGFCR